MKFILKELHKNISNDELIQDLKKVYLLLQEKSLPLTARNYESYGKYSRKPFTNRFKSWNNALKEAGLEPTMEKDIRVIDLYKNIENIWIIKGKQPISRDLSDPISKYSMKAYSNKFGSWQNALCSFVQYMNKEEIEENDEMENIKKDESEETTNKHKTQRNISDRMRFRILARDGFTCQSCGASPIKERGVQLQVDHIIPWSKGGETIEENLITKCQKCNLGKGNKFEV